MILKICYIPTGEQQKKNSVHISLSLSKMANVEKIDNGETVKKLSVINVVNFEMISMSTWQMTLKLIVQKYVTFQLFSISIQRQRWPSLFSFNVFISISVTNQPHMIQSQII
ncbi:hypothetical protein M9Y10_003000 [Tritrichomonas musculus]|uniref:Uncharacterized protein n=1 Tax=Tritrichomonas musculus TaxID=1915356 RepID=A0ABR2LBC7_9EUKA